MNAASIVVLIVVLALCGLAVWRVRRKGTPCLCGKDPKTCGGRCGCCRPA